MEAAIGDNIKIHERIGRGGFSTVYRCTDNKGSEFAVKRCDIGKFGIPHPQELSMMMSISHPNLNNAYKIYASQPKNSKKKHIYIFMELAKCDLSRLVRHDKRDEKSKPDANSIRKWLCELASAVSCLHKQNIVHADIKCGNLLLFGTSGSIKLSDFTLSIKLWSPDIRYTHKVGTSTHRPIENHMEKEWDTSLDIWSLGCTFYEMIYGHLLFPYQGDISEVPKDHLDDRCINCLMDWGNNGPIKQNYNATTTKYDYNKFNLVPEFYKDPYGINDLLLRMLSLDKSHRPTIDEIMKHRLFVGCPKMNYTLLSTPKDVVPEKKLSKIVNICNNKGLGQNASMIAIDLYSRTCRMSKNDNDTVRIYACIWISCKLCHKVLPVFDGVSNSKVISMERSICAFLEYRLHYSN